MNRFRLAILVLFSTVVWGPADAATIYDNGTPQLLGFTGIASDFEFPLQAADDFVLNPGQNVIRGIHWWAGGPIDSGLANDFTIRIFEDAGGMPDAFGFQTVFQGSANREIVDLDPNSTAGSDLRFFYTSNIAPVVLDPGTTHWLSIINQSPPGTSTLDFWDWGISSELGNLFARISDGDVWGIPGGGETAFFLTDGEPVIPRTLHLAPPRLRHGRAGSVAMEAVAREQELESTYTLQPQRRASRLRVWGSLVFHTRCPPLRLPPLA